MIIDNPKIKDSYKFEEDVYLLSAVKGEGILNGVSAKNIFDLKFWEVEKIKRYFNQMTDEAVKELMTIFYGKHDLKEVRALQFYRAFNYIKEQVNDVYEKEKLLSSEANQKLIDAGINDLNIFGSLNLLDDLGKDFGKSPEEIEQWKYSLVFALSLKRKREADIRKRLEQ